MALSWQNLGRKFVTAARSVTAGTGLTGGGTLDDDRTLSVSYGTTAGTAAQGNDSRLSDARTPTSHAASHASGGGDAVTPAAIGAATSGHTHALPAHATTHASGGSDPVTPAAIGAASSGHAHQMHSARRHRISSAVSIGAAAIVPITFTATTFTYGTFVTTQTSTLTATVSGLYLVSAGAVISGTGTLFRDVIVYRNGAILQEVGASTPLLRGLFSFQQAFTAGDTVSLSVYSDGAATCLCVGTGDTGLSLTYLGS